MSNYSPLIFMNKTIAGYHDVSDANIKNYPKLTLRNKNKDTTKRLILMNITTMQFGSIHVGSYLQQHTEGIDN